MIEPFPREILVVLNQAPLFATLKGTARRRLAEAAEFHEVPARTKLFAEGARCNGLWLMVSGGVMLYLTGSTGQIHITSLAGPAQSLDLVAALDGGGFGVTAETISPAQVLQIPRGVFLSAAAQSPSMLHAAVDQLCTDLRRRDVALAIGGLKNSRQRLACTVIRWTAQHSLAAGPGDRTQIPYPLMRQDLAASVGVTLETAIRQLSPLERDGIIHSSKNGLEIRDRGRLAAVAQCPECTFPCSLWDHQMQMASEIAR